MVGPGVTPQHDKVGLTIRQRKFPGPAGLLPDKVSGSLVTVIDQLNINIMVYGTVTACSLVDMYQCFGGTCCFCLQGRREKIKAAGFSETWVHFYQIGVVTLEASPLLLSIVFSSRSLLPSCQPALPTCC
jgi:hypothetical protein